MADNTATYIEDGEKKSGVVSDNSTNYYKQVAERYKAQLDAQKASTAEQLALTQQAQQQQLNYDLESQKAGYDATNKQLYLDRMAQQKNLPQQLASVGITGGAAESSLIGIGSNYAQRLADNEQARMANEAALRQSYAQNDYAARANALSANATAEQNYYTNQNAMYEAQYQQQLNEAATREAAGDFSLSVALGKYTQEEADRLYKIWAFENKKLAAAVDGYGTQNGSGAKPKKKTTIDDLYKEAIEVYESTDKSKGDVAQFLKENQGEITATEMSTLYRKLQDEGYVSKSGSGKTEKTESRVTGAQK